MILTPDDHRSLQAMNGELAACEPHLAAMFAIFSRLNAEEPPPPSEDLIVARRPAAAPAAGTKAGRRGVSGRGPRSRAARARLAARRRGRRGWLPLAAVAVPMLMLVTVLVMMFFGLASAMKCSPATTVAQTTSTRTALAVPTAAGAVGCQKSPGQAKLAGG